MEENYTECPHCNVRLKKIKLNKHIQNKCIKLHSKNKTKRKRRYNYPLSSDRVLLGVCIHCGRAAIPGESLCYSCS